MDRNIIRTTTGKAINFVGTTAEMLTPSDTDVFEPGYVYIGGDGDVSCVPVGNELSNPVDFIGLHAGTILPVLVRRVRAVNTTATDLLLIR